MKTTRKEFKALVQEHIQECLSNDYNEKENLSLQEQLQNVVNEFTNWYSPYEQKMQENKSEAFKSFLMGLPSVLSVEHSSFMVLTTLTYFFEECGETYKERHADKEMELYLHLLYREFCVMCKKNNVQF